MHKNLSGVTFPLLSSLTVSGILIFSHNQAFAQITPDDTLGDESSVVNSRDATSDSIDGGAVRGENLFHSFQEFNVGEDRGVYFANPDAVTNIFSRVTGNDVSNILGTLGVDGAANLYLINPNGIVFGKGASLDVQGSFTATTADGIEFGEQGFFSTVNPESPPLLTINPSAYLFNQAAPGAIANNSKASADFNPDTSFDDDFFGLRVPDGQSLLLLGGDIKTDGGGLVASGGRIDLGAIAGEGVVGLNANGSLNIPDGISRGDVSLTNGAGFLVAGDGGGDLAIAAKDISLDSASITAGIYSNLDSPNAQAGDLIINATDNITVDNSRVANEVNLETVGNAGDIFINAGSFQVLNGSQIGSPTFGKGDGGNVTVRASNIELAGTSSDGLLNSGLFTTVTGSQAQGNGGNLTISTDSLSLSDRAEISASTSGEGDSGNITITADNSISLDASSYIANNVEDINAVGNAGKIDITTGSLSATNGSQINSFTRGRGNAGDITIQATNEVTFDGVDNQEFFSSAFSNVDAGAVGNGGEINITARSLSLTNGGQLTANVKGASDSLAGGKGQGGNINIDVNDTLTIAGQTTNGIFANLGTDAVGNAGNVDIQAGTLNIRDGGFITSSTFGQGNAGDITIQASDGITFDGVDSDSNYSGSYSKVEAGGVGDGGEINITANSLSLTNGGQLEASVSGASDSLQGGKGQGGNINIDVDDTLTIANGNRPGIFASLGIGAVGKGGKINIQTGNLVVEDSGEVTSSTFGQGNAGNIAITADNAISLDASSYILNNVQDINAIGDAGKIDITTGSLSATNGSQINSFTRGRGNAGDITIQATNEVTFDGVDNQEFFSSAFSNVDAGAVGNGGEINITARSLSLTNGGQLDASVREAFDTFQGGKGQGGNINIDVNDTLTIANGNRPGIFADLEVDTVGKGGNIDIQTGNLLIQDGGEITSNTFGQGNAGTINITTGSLSNDGVISSGTFGKGNAGKIDITTGSLTNGGFINSSTFSQGNAGDITIQATDTVTFDGFDDNRGSVLSAVGFDAVGKGGNIDIQAGNLIIQNGAFITSSTVSQGDSGNITITTGSLSAKNGALITSSTLGKGNAGDITIQATDAVTFDGFSNNNYSSAFSTVEAGSVGNGGEINITAGSLSLTNGGQLEASVREASDSLAGGEGQGGNINIDVDDTLTIANGNQPRIFASLGTGAVGSAGNIDIQAGNLLVKDGGQISSSTLGQGNAGDITIKATDAVTFDGFDRNDNYSGSASNVGVGAVGDGGNINITASSLSLTNGGYLTASVREASDSLAGGKGQGGNINIDVDNTLTIADENRPGIFASLGTGAVGSAGNVDIQAGNLLIQDGGQISSSTFGQGDSGNIAITADNSISLDASSYIINNVQDINAVGNAGKIDITTGSLSVTNGSQINSFTRGQGNAGSITIQAIDAVTFDGFDREGLPSSLNTIVEDGAVGDGGNISLTAGNIRLRNDSDISTYVFNGTSDGGDINITADSVIAFDDSDIFAFAADGKGGNINLDTPAFFAENFTLNSLTSNSDTLDLNSRADVNATGAVSGSVSIPDVNFIQNSLNNLPGNSINTDELVANSCVVPVGDRKKGKFVITGTESLPVRPGDGIPSKYPTGEVRNVPENNHSSWRSGDPIVEPQGAYRLANGKLVLSRQCSQ